ncbi:hypothetical protein FP382_26060 [Klebsiella quasipneumoniae]|nr:hypothetical protein [Klebsiella quasipneumoniae]
MLHAAALIAPIIGYCSFSCGITSYLWCKGKELSKLGWVLAICNVAASTAGGYFGAKKKFKQD